MKKRYRIPLLVLAGMVILSACQLENQADGAIIEAEEIPRVLAPIDLACAPVKISAGTKTGEAAFLNVDLEKLRRNINSLEIQPNNSGRNIQWEIWAAPFPLGDSPDTQPGAIKAAAGVWNFAAGEKLKVDFMEGGESLVIWRFDARYIQIRQITAGSGIPNAAFQENGSSITLEVYGHFSGEVDKTRLAEACSTGMRMLRKIGIYKPAYKALHSELYGHYDGEGHLLSLGAMQILDEPEDETLALELKLARQILLDQYTEKLCDAIQTILLAK
jgi:hypothetical protein